MTLKTTYYFTYFSSVPKVEGFSLMLENKILENFVNVRMLEFEGMPVFVIKSDETKEMVFVNEFRDFISKNFPAVPELVWLSPSNIDNENDSWMGERTLKVKEFLLTEG